MWPNSDSGRGVVLEYLLQKNRGNLKQILFLYGLICIRFIPTLPSLF